MNRLHRYTHAMAHWMRHPAYPFILALLAGLDLFVFFIPTDGLFLLSIAGHPKRSVILTLFTSIGSTIGAIFLAYLISTHGISIIHSFAPNLLQQENWKWAEHWFQLYGIGSVFGISALPLVPHPILILAALAQVSTIKIGLAYLAGRILKFGVYAWLFSHAPQVLKRFKFIQKEVHELQDDEPKL